MVRYTPALIAAARRRYEETDDSMPSIAADCGISLRTLHRMVDREGWRKRAHRPPRDLSPASKLLEDVIALERVFYEQQRLK